MEMRQETDYVTHHIQKVIGVFAAMYNFQKYLTRKGHKVIYYQINDEANTQSLQKNIEQLVVQQAFTRFEYLLPDEYRLDEELKHLCRRLDISSAVYDTEHFITTRNELATLFEGKKTFLMESFYRTMRKKHQVLMQGSNPYGGTWNYDHNNRQHYQGEVSIPAFLDFKHNYSSIETEIVKAGVKTIGEANAENFGWPTTRKEGLQLIDYFITHLLPYFGKYQDAMHTTNWHLFHSRVSFALNIKLISPLELIRKVEAFFYKHPGHASIEQVEGYIRQVLGWREYMRGIYWAKMPGFKNLNYFNHKNKLPDWFWSGHTKLNCAKHTIHQSLKYAYAHHIQRLMVTGNFALLAQIDPDAVDEWYLGIYIDAFEWVEITNTRGMSQFADGGIVGSKPYVSSATYIHKMSNYCKTCFYDKTKKAGERACPFNSLYWLFYDTNRSKLQHNPRVSMMYRVWDKMTDETKQAILAQAKSYLNNLNQL